MRSQLEASVDALLRRSKLTYEYESHVLPVTITMQTQPDFFLPDIQTVLEVKGKCQNSMEFRKLVSTATQVKQGVLLGDVTYKSYVVAVQVTPSEMAHYLSVLADINRLVKTTQRGTFPLTGLKLLAALQRANVEAVPITYDKLSALVTKLKSKRATSQ